MPFPQVSIAHKLAGQLTRLEREFGMTPSARTRISVAVAKPVRDPAKVRFFESAATRFDTASERI